MPLADDLPSPHHATNARFSHKFYILKTPTHLTAAPTLPQPTTTLPIAHTDWPLTKISNVRFIRFGSRFSFTRFKAICTNHWKFATSFGQALKMFHVALLPNTLMMVSCGLISV
jgi:hypothetical protein